MAETKLIRLETKIFDIEDVTPEGQFKGLLSVYENVDLVDDVVRRGAFTKYLGENGNNVVILDHHDDRKTVGTGTVEDRQDGLYLTGQLELELDDAKTVLIRMRKKLITGLSIGYSTKRYEFERKNDCIIRHIIEAELLEASVVAFPANPLARITDVKSREQEVRELKERIDKLEAKLYDLTTSQESTYDRAIRELHGAVTGS